MLGRDVGNGRGRPPERRCEVPGAFDSFADCCSSSPFAYIKLEAEEIVPCFERGPSTSDEFVDRASEAWKNRGEFAARSLNEFCREPCDPSAVNVFARRLLGWSPFTPRAGLRSVRRGALRPRPTVGWAYETCEDGAGGVFVGEENARSRRVLRGPDRGVMLALRKVGVAEGSSLQGVE